MNIMNKFSFQILLLAVNLLCLKFLAEAKEFVDGVFIVNEDWYGHQNSTVNWISDQGEWDYRVFQSANTDPYHELGCTNQYGQIYGGRFYLIAKQDKDPGSGVTGGRITVADAKTMKVLFQTSLIDPSGRQCDGRSYLGVDEHKGYISSSNGIWVFDTDTYEVRRQVAGSENPNGTDGKPNSDPTGSLYHGQCGTMVRVNDRVFAAHQAYGLLVIDPLTDDVTDIITMQPVYDLLPEPSEGKEKTMPGIGSVVLAKDGSIWVSVAKDINGMGDTLPFIMKVDPATLQTQVIQIPSSCYPPANSWYAWTPDGFCASTQNNVLYWNGGPNSWFSNAHIYRYDIDKNEVSCIIDFDQEATDNDLDGNSRWNLYGCSMRVHPVSDEIYMSLFHKFQSPVYLLRRSNASGETLAEYNMIENYWFPSIQVFPDNFPPEIHNPGDLVLSPEGKSVISLESLFTDRDNMDAAIVKSIVSVSDPKALHARLIDGNMEITPLLPEIGVPYEVSIKGNSNGKTATAVLRIVFSSSGIDITNSETGTGTVCYGLDGRKIQGVSRDSRIVIMKSDNKTIKTIIR